MIIIDSVVALLLFVCILYCWKLNKRIMALQASHAEWVHVIGRFDSAMGRAQTGIEELRQEHVKAERELKHLIGEGERLFDDLSYVHRRGEDLATRLERHITEARYAAEKVKALPVSRPSLQTKIEGLDAHELTSPMGLRAMSKADKEAKIRSLLERHTAPREMAYATSAIKEKGNAPLPLKEKSITSKPATAEWHPQVIAKAKQDFINSLRKVAP